MAASTRDKETSLVRGNLTQGATICLYAADSRCKCSRCIIIVVTILDSAEDERCAVVYIAAWLYSVGLDSISWTS